jgi:hypothetical protein
MKFPYGISDFYKLITEGYFYQDRTDSIPLIEAAGSQLLFLRPRRFGKSLLLSMLENYYDVARADEFQQLFGHLYIGQNPTPLHNQYLVLKWDFSAVDPAGDAERIQRALHDHVNGSIEYFVAYYHDLLQHKIMLDKSNALRSFQSLLAAVARTPYRLYLLIDEYDNFANEVLMGGGAPSSDRYQDLLYGEGALKTVFKAIKAAGAGRGLDRAFITGVSPVVLSDVTSGYNIAENISLQSTFHDLCGFRESEVTGPLQQVVEACGWPTEKTAEALEMIRTFYNGYRFSFVDEEPVYNPTLVLYFLKAFQRERQYPHDLLDSNLAMDRSKIAYISRLPNGAQTVSGALDEGNPPAIAALADRFGVEQMLYTVKDNTFMVSLLYYFGVLTLAGRTALGKLAFRIPNLVVRRLYVEQLRDMLLPDANRDEAVRAAEALYGTGDMQPLCDFVERHYFKVLDNRDYRWANELTVKTAFLTLLFNDTFYVMDSEMALERDYADLTMIVRPDMRQYQLVDVLIEFKYVGLQELGLSGDEVRRVERAELQALPPVQQKLATSQRKLEGYRATLQSVYGDRLRLHTFSVVALGFERLVWQELAPDL